MLHVTELQRSPSPDLIGGFVQVIDIAGHDRDKNRWFSQSRFKSQVLRPTYILLGLLC